MADYIQSLRDQRATVRKAQKDILDRAEAEKRGLTGAETESFDKADQDIETLSGDIERREKHAQREAEAAASQGRKTDPETPVRGADRGVDEPGKPITLKFEGAKPFNGMVSGREDREVQISPDHEVAKRGNPDYRKNFARYLQGGGPQSGLFVGSDPKGGYLAPMQFVAGLIKFVDDNVFMRQLCTVLPPLATGQSLGAVSLDTDPADADWTAEVPASDMSEDDTMTLGRRELSPNLLAKLIKMSMKLLRAANMDVDGLVRSRMAYKFGVTLEKAYLTGSGADRPLGVFVASANGISTGRDITVTSAETATPTTNFGADTLINALYSLKEAYQANATWLFHRDAIKMARKLKDGDGQYLWQPGLQGGQPNLILGRPYVMSEFAPNTFTTGLYVGLVADFKNLYWIVDSLAFEIQVLLELFALKNQIGMVGRMESDGMPVLEEAAARIKLG